MNLRVNLTKRINTPEGFRYYPVVMSGNGRVKPGAVIVNGEEEKHTERDDFRLGVMSDDRWNCATKGMFPNRSSLIALF
jgi:hypothetical protein